MFRLTIILIIFFISEISYSYEDKIIVASTTSTYDSGLLTYLNKEFKKQYGIDIQVLTQGTGQALRTAKDGNVEVLMVHHKKSELEFMKNGFGLVRYDLMYNDYIIVGPISDNKKCEKLNDKLLYIHSKNLKFISRGDDSGTHKKELELWKSIKIPKKKFPSNYLKVGQGMGNTILIANELKAYTLTDRSTWISFNKKDNLKIICEFKPPLLNQYGIIIVNPKINKKLNIKTAKLYVDWLISNTGKILINGYRKNNQQLFFFNYKVD
jgi:tungstate transport system substrate-binding protein